MLPEVRELLAGLPHQLLQLLQRQPPVAVCGRILVKQLAGLPGGRVCVCVRGGEGKGHKQGGRRSGRTFELNRQPCVETAGAGWGVLGRREGGRWGPARAHASRQPAGLSAAGDNQLVAKRPPRPCPTFSTALFCSMVAASPSANIVPLEPFTRSHSSVTAERKWVCRRRQGGRVAGREAGGRGRAGWQGGRVGRVAGEAGGEG